MRKLHQSLSQQLPRLESYRQWCRVFYFSCLVYSLLGSIALWKCPEFLESFIPEHLDWCYLSLSVHVYHFGVPWTHHILQLYYLYSSGFDYHPFALGWTERNRTKRQCRHLSRSVKIDFWQQLYLGLYSGRWVGWRLLEQNSSGIWLIVAPNSTMLYALEIRRSLCWSIADGHWASWRFCPSWGPKL